MNAPKSSSRPSPPIPFFAVPFHFPHHCPCFMTLHHLYFYVTTYLIQNNRDREITSRKARHQFSRETALWRKYVNREGDKVHDGATKQPAAVVEPVDYYYWRRTNWSTASTATTIIRTNCMLFIFADTAPGNMQNTHANGDSIYFRFRLPIYSRCNATSGCVGDNVVERGDIENMDVYVGILFLAILWAEIVLRPVWAGVISIFGITRLPVTSSTTPLNSSTSKTSI